MKHLFPTLWEWAMGGLILGFLTVGALFLFLPDTLLHWANLLGQPLGFSPTSTETPPYWQVFTLAYMAAVTACGIGVLFSSTPRPYLNILFVSKLATALGAAVAFLVDTQALIYLATTVTDGSIAIFVWYYLKKHVGRE